jgi:hypothetical protein
MAKANKKSKKDKYVVVHYFIDLQDKNKEYNEGDSFPKPANKKVTSERLAELSSANNKQGRPLIKLVEEQEQEDK